MNTEKNSSVTGSQLSDVVTPKYKSGLANFSVTTVTANRTERDPPPESPPPDSPTPTGNSAPTTMPHVNHEHTDVVVVEEPLEIRLVTGPDDSRSVEPFSITMRTPGEDFDLAAGLLFTEGLLSSAKQIRTISYFGQPRSPGQSSNIVRVELQPDVTIDMVRLSRRLVSNSSCGVCGKASLDSLFVQGIQPLAPPLPMIPKQMIHAAAELLHSHQVMFKKTGGVHGAGLMDKAGRLMDVCEDVGRHNAVDKLIGRRFLAGDVPLADHILLVSGRVSFEIAQKALVAGIPMLVAIGAPSSLAVEMAERFGMTLIGFASEARFNIYTSPQRLNLPD